MTADPSDKENSMDSSEEDEETVRPVRKRSRRGGDRTRSGSSDSDSGRPATPEPHTVHNLVEGYRDLTNEMCNLDIRPDNTVHNARRATSLIDRADGLADLAYTTNGSAAATYDGEFMNVTGQVVSRIAETMEVDSRIFCVREFASCLKHLIFGSRHAAVTRKALSEFNRKYCRPISRSSAPILKFVHGAYNFIPSSGESVPQPDRPVPKKRTRLHVSPTKTRAAVIRSEESLQNVDKDKTVIEVERLQAEIEQMYVQNEQVPVPYLTIVVNTADFGKTVENVFHFSFLVKEGYDRLVDHNGITCVVPVEEEERTSNSNAHANQVLFSFTQKDWEKWCQKVQSPAYKIR